MKRYYLFLLILFMSVSPFIKGEKKAICEIQQEVLRPFIPGEKSTWNGCDRYDFLYKNREAIIVAPHKAAKGNPWIWRPVYFDAFAQVDAALLEQGFYVVYYDLTNSYGSPETLKPGTEFYQYVVESFQFSTKVTLEGFSRGGLSTLNWAALNPEKVACIYLDAPVCNVFSWPGRRSPVLWNELLTEWGMKDESMSTFKESPIDHLEPIAKAGISILSVCGDIDKVVPVSENTDILCSRYRALGGHIEVIIKKGVEHHPHSLENPKPIVDFILAHQP